jgi:carbamoyl-phosphate synthase large subunit
MVSGTVDLLINTPLGKLTQRDDYEIRRTALQLRLPYITTLSAARAACDAIFAMRRGKPTVRCLQEWHDELRAAGAVPQDSGAVAD